jgi:signal transduction histidine kinase/ligand-binding sensor domain-containing protein
VTSRRVRIVVALAVVASSGARGRADPLPLAVDVPFAASAVFAFAQTTDGTMWAVGQQGALRWNGRRVTFDEGPAWAALPRGQQLFAAAADRDGALWVGFGGTSVADGLPGAPGVVVVDPGAARARPSLAALAREPIWALAANDAGVWIGGEHGLWRFSRAGALVEVGAAIDVRGRIAPVVAGRGGVAVGSDRGVALVEERAALRARWDVGRPRAIAMDGDGVVWAATRRGLYRLRDGAPAALADARFGDAAALAFDGEGALWIGTWSGLVRRAADGVVTTFGRAEGLPDERVQALGTDADGGVWVGTRAGGVARVHRPLVASFGPAQGIAGGYVHGVVAAPDGVVWAATPRGLASLTVTRDGVAGRVRPFPRELGDADVSSLARSDDGDLWIGSRGAGLLRWSEARRSWRRYGRADGVDDDVALVFADRGALWVAGRATLARAAVAPDALAIADRHEGLPCLRELVAASAGPSATWFVGRSGALLRVEGARAACVTPEPAGAPITTVLEDADGTRWLGAGSDAGLVRWRASGARAFREEDGLMCDSIAAILDDRAGGLWTPCGRGVQRIDRGALDDVALGRATRVSPLRWTGESGLRSAETSLAGFPHAALDRDGRLWVATVDGIAAITPPERAPPSWAPRARLTSISIAGTERAGPEIAVRGAPAAVRAVFEAPAMQAAAGVRVRWRWRSPAGASEPRLARPDEPIELGELDVGTHALELEASDGYGAFRRAAEVALVVDVRPRLLEAGWFRSLAALAAAAAAALVLVLRGRRRAQRDATVRAERERIARELHDGLGQGFASLGLHLGSIERQVRERLAGDVPPRLEQAIERTAAIARHMADDAKQAIWDLRADELGAQPLDVALRELARTLETTPGGPRVVVESAGSAGALVDHELAQIAREATTNAVKHGRARTITLRVTRTADRLTLEVTDDGAGFTVDRAGLAKAGHFGILGMQERARRMNGTVEIASSPGAGSRVVVTVPIGRS